MKAVRLLEYGGQLVFNDVPTPTVAPSAAERGRSRMNRTTLNHKQKEIESWSAS